VLLFRRHAEHGTQKRRTRSETVPSFLARQRECRSEESYRRLFDSSWRKCKTAIANVINADINHDNAEYLQIDYRVVDDFQVHCNYSSHIIYQTIKLFDVIIDRILVETDNIQLIALACLWINLKRETIFMEIPSVMKSFVSIIRHHDMFSHQSRAFRGTRQYFLMSLLYFPGDNDTATGKGYVHWTGETAVNV